MKKVLIPINSKLFLKQNLSITRKSKLILYSPQKKNNDAFETNEQTKKVETSKNENSKDKIYNNTNFTYNQPKNLINKPTNFKDIKLNPDIVIPNKNILLTDSNVDKILKRKRQLNNCNKIKKLGYFQ